MYRIQIQYFLISIIVLLILFSASAFCDELKMGQRVKINCDTTIAENKLIDFDRYFKQTTTKFGLFKSQSNDSIFIQPDYSKSDFIGIPKERINTVCIGSTRRNTIKGLVYGTGIGAAFSVFAMYGAAAGYPDDENEHPDERGNIALRVGAMCIVGGAVIGTFVGWVAEEKTWRRIEKSQWAVNLDANFQKEKIQLEVSFSY